MNPATPFSGDVIRKASRITVVLQVLAVALLAILVSVYMDIANRQRAMRDSVRENAMWSVYQLNREAQDLHQTLELMLAREDLGGQRLQDLALRYDIVYSRIDTLRKAQFEESFAADAEVGKHLRVIQQICETSQPLFDAVMAGTAVKREDLLRLEGDLDVLSQASSDLLIYTNTFVSTERAQSRVEIEALQRKAMTLIGLLVVSVAVLIITLQRQLRNVQAAGVSLEAMAEELSISYQAAEAGNRAKSQFMATMGHEIRTPLNAILGMVELLELTRLSAEAAAHVRTIRGSGEALLDIINEILDYAKIEHGKLELERRAVDLQQLAETSVDMMRGRAAESRNLVTLDLPEHWRTRFVLSDPTRLRQVILNLMSNAVKFTQDGMVTLRMQQTLRKGALWLRVEVEDTGIGIDEAGRAKLFRPFSQVDASISRRYGGTGLGLTICKEIIDRFGGTMGVESVPGEGSIFWFELPVERTEAPAAGGAVQAEATLAPAPRLRILVVEDNKVNQQVILGYLRHLGQEAVVAENGLLGVERARAEAFDLILMDMQMPVMDGIEAARQIRSTPGPSCTTPIVALTANASEDDRRTCLAVGMSGFQAKPIGIAVLHRLILDIDRQRPKLPTITPMPKSAVPSAPSEPTITADVQPDEPAIGPGGESGAAPMAADDAPASMEIATSIQAERRQEIVDILGEDGFQELLDAFFEDAAEILRGLGECMQSGDRSQLDPLLHSLKGSASNVGLVDISALAQALRHREPETNEIEKLTRMVKAAQDSLAA